MNIDALCIELENALRAELLSQGHSATGTLLSSQEVVNKTNTDILIEGYHIFYGDYVNRGRKRGAMPPVAAIEEWIRAKGLDLNAWAVAKSIAAKGTRAYREGKIKYIDNVLDRKKSIIEEAITDYVGKILFAVIDIKANDIDNKNIQII